MALGDNIVFAHFFDSLDSDEPVITPTNTSGNGDPTLSGGVATFDGTDGLLFTGSNTFNPGSNGDWAIALRGKISTDSYSTNRFIHLGDQSNWTSHIFVSQGPGTKNLTARVYYASATHYLNSTDNSFVVGTTFTCVVNFDSGDATQHARIYVDGTDESSGWGGDFNAPNGGAALDPTSSTQVSLGSYSGGGGTLDGEIDWVVVWDRALTSSEITNNMNETDLKNALGGGGGGGASSTLALLGVG